jgi:uncharacterized protein (TIGR03083 family)
VSYHGAMELDDYLAVIAAEGERFVAAAVEAGLDAPVPTCPDWVVRDVVLHNGEVHRWATAVVRGQATNLGQVPEDYLGPLPSDAEALDWFRAGVADLLDALRTADPTVGYATFLENPPPSRLLFWARRQAHELGMHRVDIESALARCTPFGATYGADGVDEFLCGFVSRKRTKLHSAEPRSLLVAPIDSPQRWLLTISEAPPLATRIEAEAELPSADCVVTGTAHDLVLALWNRTDLTPFTIAGDRSVFELVRDSIHIRWS